MYQEKNLKTKQNKWKEEEKKIIHKMENKQTIKFPKVLSNFHFEKVVI